MPGRHGAMRHGRNRSKRQRPDEMETTLKDSIHNSRRKEQSILKHLVPPRLQGVKKTVVPTRRLAGAVTTRLERDAATAVEGEMAAVPGATDVDPASVIAKLAALRQAVNAPTVSLKLGHTVDWATKRDDPAPTPNLDPRRVKIFEKRKAIKDADAAARNAAAAKRAARREAAAAAAAEEDGDDAEEGADASASPMDKVRAMAAKMPRLGKKASATAAFKVLKAKIGAERDERILKKADKKAKAKAKAKLPPVEESDAKKGGKKGGKGAGKKGGGKGKKSGSKGWAPVRAFK